MLLKEKGLHSHIEVQPFKTQLLKWVGNKQRFAHEIISYFPPSYKQYYEPFLGSGAVMATLAPQSGLGSDFFEPLMGIWKVLKSNPEELKRWYRIRWELIDRMGKKVAYEHIKTSYNASPNAPDFLFLTRACYGGVVRFRKLDGYISTPCGVHTPISPESFSKRVDLWFERTQNVDFKHLDYKQVFNMAKAGDLIYCDPPYNDSQAILYGAQQFVFEDLIKEIAQAKSRGVFVALSIDGTKESGLHICSYDYPKGLFTRKINVNCGKSMLKRFQMQGETLDNYEVSDKLMLTY